MKKLQIILLCILFSQGIFATKHTHNDEYAVRYIKESVQLNHQYQQQLRNAPLWQNFLATNPDWFVIFNENNQLPHRAFGTPILTNNLFTFLSANNFSLPPDLREEFSIKNDKYINTAYVQYYNHLEVVNSKLYAKFTINNELVSFGLDIFSDIAISTVPSLSTSEAIVAASINIIHSISNQKVEEELKILPIPVRGKYIYHLVYEVYLETRIEQGPAHYVCYVDAHTGELLMRKNQVLYESPPIATSSVVGDVYTTHPYNPSSVEKLKYIRAKDQATGQSYYADANGDITIPLAIGTQIRYKLEGLYADVQTNIGTFSNPLYSTPDIFANLSATNTISFDNTNSTIQERTAYYAVNEIHDHMKTVFPSFTSLDMPLETNVDESGTCNAFFAGSSINFYEEGLSTNGTDYCEATAKIVDVVYHEYGHAINGNRYNSGSGMWNGALNEGFADIWAFTITEDPILGIGFYQNNPTGFVRRYDQDRKVYPQDLKEEVHADGEIIAGCFWDLYLNLGSMPQTIDLFKYTFDSGVDGADGTEGVIFTDILVEVLFADDNDANIINGTPNDLAIVEAFAKHGITLLSNAVINHTPVTTSNGNIPITISANISLTYPWALASANCHYRINKDTNWVSAPMTTSGSSMQAQLPSQPNGTVIAYYIALEDVYGYLAGITPMASHLSPIHNANLPYFVMVGYSLMEEEDFDFSGGFWQLGAANDNASTGMWEIGVPIGSYDDPYSLSGIVQTDAQHTSGGSNCAFTGNAYTQNGYPDPNAAIGENDVDDGHTTLLSPYYNLAAYNDPAFSYWRWYTNSPSSGANPGADWWQVMITDDGTNWHYVENNMSSDISWRKMAFRVKDYVSLTNSIQLKFIASDSIHLGQYLDGGSLVEAAVDDLYLYEANEQTTNIMDIVSRTPKLIKITDLLGRTVDPITLIDKTTLLYIYDDGTVEKRIVIE